MVKRKCVLWHKEEHVKTNKENGLPFLTIDSHSYHHLEQIFLTIFGFTIQSRQYDLFLFMEWTEMNCLSIISPHKIQHILQEDT